MIDELEKSLESFLDAANQTCCFTYILNLVAKSILWQFDVPKAKASEVLDAAVCALADILADLEDEEDQMEEDTITDDGEGKNEDGLIDIRGSMTVEEIEELDKSIQPVHVVFIKVSSISDSKLMNLTYLTVINTN
jgi:hypothetical protein